MEILHALTEMASVAHGGCIFCSNKGSGELIRSAPDISSQITQYFESYRAKRANKFIAYFQNFTNTYEVEFAKDVAFYKIGDSVIVNMLLAG